MKKITIKPEEENINIKDFLLKVLKNVTSSKIEKSLKNGDIKLNNKKVSYQYSLKKNDVIKVFINFKEEKIDMSFMKSEKSIDVFYEDDNILIINKKRNIVCQEDKTHKIEHLNNQLKKYLYLKKEWDPNNIDGFVPNLCHRLDKDTIGLIIAAKNIKSLREMNLAFIEKYISKKYIAFALGYFKNKEGTLENFIMKNDQLNMMQIDTKNLYNKKIITKYKVLEEKKDYSVLDIEILTGKKHQIRLHLSSINHPILGDKKYNKISSLDFKNLCLCSYEFKFRFPNTFHLSYLNNKKFKLNSYIFT